MLPSEMVILMAISINKDTGHKLLAHSLDITNDYIDYLYNSLVNRGFLKGHRTTGFRLTAIGKEAIQCFTKEHGSKDLDAIERLRALDIEIGQEEKKINQKRIKASTRLSTEEPRE
jgi:DNA-binding MarR family transcriptional regulator